MATESELTQFLKSVEKRAFKRSLYNVRDEDAALDIVQDSMMKLAEHYGDKPVAELPMLFQRILSNTTLDWFRRHQWLKVEYALERGITLRAVAPRPRVEVTREKMLDVIGYAALLPEVTP